MSRIDYLLGARRDFNESFDWYATRSLQAAVRFAGSVDAALMKVAEDPIRYDRVDGVHRECPLKRFPFRLVYRVLESGILVVAIAHTKRKTRYWRNRD
jgi:plasmid stabilization system protein ParE